MLLKVLLLVMFIIPEAFCLPRDLSTARKIATTDRKTDAIEGNTEVSVESTTATTPLPSSSVMSQVEKKDLTEAGVRDAFAQILQDMLVLVKKGSSIRRFG